MRRHEAVGRPTPSVLRGWEETPHACPLYACGREGDRLRVSSWTGRRGRRAAAPWGPDAGKLVLRLHLGGPSILGASCWPHGRVLHTKSKIILLLCLQQFEKSCEM